MWNPFLSWRTKNEWKKNAEITLIALEKKSQFFSLYCHVLHVFMTVVKQVQSYPILSGTVRISNISMKRKKDRIKRKGLKITHNI